MRRSVIGLLKPRSVTGLLKQDQQMLPKLRLNGLARSTILHPYHMDGATKQFFHRKRKEKHGLLKPRSVTGLLKPMSFTVNSVRMTTVKAAVEVNSAAFFRQVID
ncbi:unnamed protein product [Ilex paraguariensis]|uniref:Uncharacterized protein n=1 Tax=Ilex paraguariensis TaxID=185542 RepID=A0ABC8RSC4_9AQUA